MTAPRAATPAAAGKRRERVYLSGPVSLGGRLEPEVVAANVARFRRVSEEMAGEGIEVLDPTTIAGDVSWSWCDWMRAAVTMLLRADRVHLLPGWEQSPGARVEVGVAHSLGIAVSVAGEQ